MLLSKKTEEIMILREIHGDEFVYDSNIVKDMAYSLRSGEDTASVLSDKLSATRSQIIKK